MLFLQQPAFSPQRKPVILLGQNRPVRSVRDFSYGMNFNPRLCADDPFSWMKKPLGVKPILFRRTILPVAAPLFPQLIGEFRNVIMSRHRLLRFALTRITVIEPVSLIQAGHVKLRMRTLDLAAARWCAKCWLIRDCLGGAGFVSSSFFLVSAARASEQALHSGTPLEYSLVSAPHTEHLAMMTLFLHSPERGARACAVRRLL
jgi:hypothetical protein